MMNTKIRTIIAAAAATLALAAVPAASQAAVSSDTYDSGSATTHDSSSSSTSTTWPVNDIKIGNRSQFSSSNTSTISGRPQVLVFKIGRVIISSSR